MPLDLDGVALDDDAPRLARVGVVAVDLEGDAAPSTAAASLVPSAVRNTMAAVVHDVVDREDVGVVGDRDGEAPHPLVAAAPARTRPEDRYPGPRVPPCPKSPPSRCQWVGHSARRRRINRLPSCRRGRHPCRDQDVQPIRGVLAAALPPLCVCLFERATRGRPVDSVRVARLQDGASRRAAAALNVQIVELGPSSSATIFSSIGREACRGSGPASLARDEVSGQVERVPPGEHISCRITGRNVLGCSAAPAR